MIVATYQTKAATVHIADDALQRLSPAQIEQNRRTAQLVASRILDRAVARGDVEGLTPEEYRRRFRGNEYGDG